MKPMLSKTSSFLDQMNIIYDEFFPYFISLYDAYAKDCCNPVNIYLVCWIEENDTILKNYVARLRQHLAFTKNVNFLSISILPGDPLSQKSEELAHIIQEADCILFIISESGEKAYLHPENARRREAYDQIGSRFDLKLETYWVERHHLMALTKQNTKTKIVPMLWNMPPQSEPPYPFQKLAPLKISNLSESISTRADFNQDSYFEALLELFTIIGLLNRHYHLEARLNLKSLKEAYVQEWPKEQILALISSKSFKEMQNPKDPCETIPYHRGYPKMYHPLFTPKTEESKVLMPASERLESYFRALLMQHARLDKKLTCYLCYYEDPSDFRLMSFIQRLKHDLDAANVEISQFKIIVGLGAHMQSQDLKRLIQQADCIFYIGSRAGQTALQSLPPQRASLPYFDTASLAQHLKAEQFRVETLLIDTEAAEKPNVIPCLWNGSKKSALPPSAATLNQLHLMAYEEQVKAYEDLESDRLRLKSYEENLIDVLARLGQGDSSVLNAKQEILKQMIQNEQSDQEIDQALGLGVTKSSPTFQT